MYSLTTILRKATNDTTGWHIQYYPHMFRGIPDEPKQIQVYGEKDLVNAPCLAIIGTRAPSPYAYQVAFKLAEYYAANGYCIVSGLAPGIDTAAHRGALAAKGQTIAVLACRPDNYSEIDRVHKDKGQLAKEIIKSGQGLLLSEYLTPAYEPKRYFERDRLIAGLCHIVIPVQCGVKSGTLHTVDHAIAQQNRRIYVPRPNPQDEKQCPDKYAGIRELLTHGIATAFSWDERDHIL